MVLILSNEVTFHHCLHMALSGKYACEKHKNKIQHFSWPFQNTEPLLNLINKKTIWRSVGVHIQSLPSCSDLLAALLQHTCIYIMRHPSVTLRNAAHSGCSSVHYLRYIIHPPLHPALSCFNASLMYCKLHPCEDRHEQVTYQRYCSENTFCNFFLNENFKQKMFC